MPIQKYVKSAGKEKNRMGHKITLARLLVPYLKNKQRRTYELSLRPNSPARPAGPKPRSKKRWLFFIAK